MSRFPLRPAALVAGLAAAILGLSACGSGPTDAASPPESPRVAVVASTDVWAAVARAVGGEFVEVEALIDSASQDPHGYEATPQDAATVGDGQLIVMNGGGYDAFMTGLVEASGNPAPVVDAVAVSGVAGAGEAGPAHEGESPEEHAAHQGESPEEHAAHAGEQGHEQGHEHGHEHGAVNEHVWYSPPAVQEVAGEIARQLSAIDPAHADRFAGNAQALSTGIDRLTARAAGIGRAHPDARVVVTEPVPAYLLDAAGVRNVTPPEFSAAVEEGTDPPAAVVARTLDLFRVPPPADALIVNSQTGSATTDQVRAAAEQAGTPVVEMSETLPEGVTDYVPWMERNLDALAGALAR